MLGHRGCRLAITYPEIATMQVRAILEAALNVKRKGITVKPEIMIPLVGEMGEMKFLKDLVLGVAKDVFKEKKKKIPFLVGTMIEVPRAALIADEIAEEAEFFSFGTNDLTQITCGFSRDDAGKFLGKYGQKGIFEKDPFQVLDQNVTGKLIKMGVKLGRRKRKNLKVGICGEHGGEPESVRFFHRAGLDYVSC
jgi:pyruvate,orthophosphate dikinase